MTPKGFLMGLDRSSTTNNPGYNVRFQKISYFHRTFAKKWRKKESVDRNSRYDVRSPVHKGPPGRQVKCDGSRVYCACPWRTSGRNTEFALFADGFFTGMPEQSQNSRPGPPVTHLRQRLARRLKILVSGSSVLASITRNSGAVRRAERRD